MKFRTSLIGTPAELMLCVALDIILMDTKATKSFLPETMSESVPYWGVRYELQRHVNMNQNQCCITVVV